MSQRRVSTRSRRILVASLVSASLSALSFAGFALAEGDETVEIILKNGERRTGTLVDFGKRVYRVEIDGKVQEISEREISELRFVRHARPSPSPSAAPSPTPLAPALPSPSPVVVASEPPRAPSREPLAGRLVAGETWGRDAFRVMQHTNALAFADEGRTLIAGTDDGIWCFDAASGKVTRQLAADGPVPSLIVSRDERRMFSIDNRNDTIDIWDLSLGKCVRWFKTPEGVLGLCPSPDEHRAVIGSWSSKVSLVDLESGDEILRAPDDSLALTAARGKVTFGWSADGRTALLGGWPRFVSWDTTTGKLEKFSKQGSSYTTETNAPSAFSPDGSLCLCHVSSHDKGDALTLVDTRTNTILAQQWGQAGPFHALAFSPDGAHAVTVTAPFLKLWDVSRSELKEVRRWSENGNASVETVAFSRDGKRIATAGRGSMIDVWDLATGARLSGEPSGHSQLVTCIATAPDGSWCATASRDKTIRFHDARGNETARIDTAELADALAFTPDGKTLLAASYGKLTLIDTETRKSLQTLDTGTTDAVRSLEISRDGRIALLATRGLVQVWSLLGGKRIHSQGVSTEGGATFAADGKAVLAAGREGGLEALDLVTGDLRAPLPGDRLTSLAPLPSGELVATRGTSLVLVSPSGKVSSQVDLGAELASDSLDPWHWLSVSPDGRLAAVAGRDAVVRVVDLAPARTGESIALVTSTSLAPLGDWPVCLAWTGPRALAVGTSKGLVRPYTLSVDEAPRASSAVASKLEAAGTFGGTAWRAGSRTTAAVFASSKLALTGHSDGSIAVWEIASGRRLRSLTGHKAPVRSLVATRDGRTVFSASEDGTIWAWDPSSGRGERRIYLKREGIASALDKGFESVALSPDETRLLCLCEHSVYLCDASSGEQYSASAIDQLLKLGEAIFARDGQSVQIATGLGVVTWDLRSPDLSHPAEPDKHARWEWFTGPVALSADGHVLAGGLGDSRNPQFQFMDVPSNKLIARAGSSGTIKAVRFAPSGLRFLMASANDEGLASLVFHDLDTKPWTPRWFGPHMAGSPPPPPVDAIAFSPDGKLALTGGDSPVLQLWDVASGKELTPFLGHTGAVAAAAVSPSGDLVASAGEDGVAWLWNATKRRELRFARTATRVVFLSETRLIYGDATGALRLWDASSGNNGTTEALLSTDIKGRLVFAVSPSKRLVAVGGNDGAVAIHSLATRALVRKLEGPRKTIHSLAWSNDEKRVLAAGDEGAIHVWDAATGEVVLQVAGNGTPVIVARFSPDGSKVLSSGADATLHLRRADTGEPVRTLEGPTAPVFDVVFLDNGSRALSASLDGTVRLWDLAAGRELDRFTLPDDDRPLGLTVAPGGRTIYVGTQLGLVQELSLAAPPPKVAPRASSPRFGEMTTWGSNRWRSHSGVNAVLFSRDGKTVFAGGDDGSVVAWDVVQGRPRKTLGAHASAVAGLALSSAPGDEGGLFSASADGVVKRWSEANGALLSSTTIAGLDSAALAGFAISPDSKKLLVASATRLMLADAATGEEQLRFPEALLPGSSFAFSADGRNAHVALGGNVPTWDLISGKLSGSGTAYPVAASAVRSDGSVFFEAEAGDVYLFMDPGPKPAWAIAPDDRIRSSIPVNTRGPSWAFGKLTKNQVTFAMPLPAGDNDMTEFLAGYRDGSLVTWHHSKESHGHGGYSGYLAHAIKCAARTASRSRTVACDGGPLIKIWNETNFDITSTDERGFFYPQGHEAAIVGIAVSPDGKVVASSSLDGTARVFTTETGNEGKQTLSGASAPVFSPDGTEVLVGGPPADQRRFLWNVWDGRLALGHPWGGVGDAPRHFDAFSADGELIVSSGDGPLVLLRPARDVVKVKELDAGSSRITSLALAPDHARALASNAEGTIRIWETSTGKVVADTKSIGVEVASATFSPDGRAILAACADAKLRLYDAATGALARTIVGHEGAVHGAVFTPDGVHAISASEDGTLRIWNVATGEAVDGKRLADSDRPTALALSADGRVLYVGTWRGLIERFAISQK